MLTALQVRSFALFDDLELVFGPGLNVITGETGAGKSMLVEAVELVVGGRASSELIRTGEERATVDAVFDVRRVAHTLKAAGDAGYDLRGGQLVISRELSAGGRNLCRVNGRVTTASVVRELTGPLVEIHGQHEHQSLTNPARHREVLDIFGGASLLGLVSEFASGTSTLRRLERELAAVAGNARERAQREDLIRFQLAEIEAAALQPAEDELLREERQVLANAEQLAAAAEAAYELLYGGEGGGPGAGGRRQQPGGETPARDALSRALAELETAATLDRRLGPVVDSLRPLVYAAEDAATEIRKYRDGIEFDPGRLEQVQSRLAAIALLRRKYADTVDGILAYAAGLREELARLEDGESAASRLQEQIAVVRADLAKSAAEITVTRRRAAQQLVPEVTRELRSLGMPSAEFHVRLDARPDPTGLEIDGRTIAFDSSGADEVEFMLAPNPGEPPRRLAKAASGGELSRVMLAIRTVLAEADEIPSLIFDEIDSGIGGPTAVAVGLRLARLGRTRQVFCVTHLPQIASFADRHFVVRKETDGRRTVTSAAPVSGDQRLSELARMLGSAEGSPAAVEHAKELLASSQELLKAAKPT